MTRQSKFLPLLPAVAFFTGLALVMVGPSLFSCSVCSEDLPDTWIHMWAYWRAGYAVAGHDAGYLTSHVLTYPGAIREPIAAFDPLMSLLSVPLQALLPHIPAVYNVLVLLGLIGTGLATALLAAHITRRPVLGLTAGTIAIANPFVVRQIMAGYTEYAWWGIIPLAEWAYGRAVKDPTPKRIALYAGCCLILFLMSIYCAAVFVLIALLAALTELIKACRHKQHALGRVMRVQVWAVIALLPLLLFWVCQLSKLAYKGIPWNNSFPIETLRTAFPMQAKEAPPPTKESPADFLPWRTLYGSVDPHDLIHPGAAWANKQTEIRLDGRQIIPRDCMPHINSESVFAREWWLVLALAIIATVVRRERPASVRWWVLAAAFLLLSIGPYPTWNGHAVTSVTAPYAWLYRWLPGFSRLVIPGRFFLGVILAWTVLAVRGADAVRQRCRIESPSHIMIFDGTLAAMLTVVFALTGTGTLSLPATSAVVSPVHEVLARDARAGAVLALPLRGNLDRRMYAQTVHGRPIFKGSPATEWTDESGTGATYHNDLVQLFEQPRPAPAPETDWDAAREALIRQGFRFLLLHADGYATADDLAQARAAGTSLLGPPLADDTQVTAWRLEKE